jgi:alkylation response protein AidB-like acyl-CoA dehydrogenase
MDFAETPANAEFREQLREFLRAELPDWWRGLFTDDERIIPLTRHICARLAERGWLTMSWPPEFGGAGADLWAQCVLREEMWRNQEPRGPQYMNVNYIGPMIMQFGTPDQHERFLQPMAEGRVIWTQGFSEPGAGSDLAAVSTKATPVEGGYLVHGSKIWDSYADAPADWCFLVVRTDPESSKSRGLSLLLVDMHSPGLTVRPILSLAGPKEFNELFFDDVFVPSDCLLGKRDDGWTMIMAGLALERAGVPWYAIAQAFVPDLVDYCNTTVVDGAPLAARPEVRAQIAEVQIRCEAARLMHYKVVAEQAVGGDTSVSAALSIVHSAVVYQRAAQVGLDVVGPLAMLDAGESSAPIHGAVRQHWQLSTAATIAGGTVDIQRNIVAQRGLGLPRGA